MSGEDRAPAARPLILAHRQPVTAGRSRVQGYAVAVEVGGVGTLHTDIDTALAVYEALGAVLPDLLDSHPLPVPQPTPPEPFPYPGPGPCWDADLIDVTPPYCGPLTPLADPALTRPICLDDACREDVRDGRCWAGHDQAALAAAELAAAPGFDHRAPRRAAA